MSTFLTEVTCIWGCRGSGKSTLAKKMVVDAKPKRLLSVDPLASEGMDAAGIAQAFKDGATSAVCNSASRDQQLGAIYAAYMLSSPANPIYALCDEAPAYLQTFTEALRRIMFQGRHAGFGMCIIGQRPASVDANIRSQAASTYWMRLTDHVDTETASKSIGRERSQTLPSFSPGQHIKWPE